MLYWPPRHAGRQRKISAPLMFTCQTRMKGVIQPDNTKFTEPESLEFTTFTQEASRPGT